ncbi:MotE family protein [Methylocella sp.]|uniref:MotE family protein n=1 Tax=Methylocella sp. TaxID=1978226 RepID=UPI0037831C14
MNETNVARRCGDLAARHMRAARVWVGVMCVAASCAAAAEQKAERAHPIEKTSSNADLQTFCGANKAAIGDARIVWQTRRLKEIEERVRRGVADLERKKAEYEEWLRRRDDMLKQATDGVVSIYAKMRPDAAALQLALMEDQAAAAILAKMPPRASSAIMNEMEVGRAARLTRVLSGPEPQVEKKS